MPHHKLYRLLFILKKLKNRQRVVFDSRANLANAGLEASTRELPVAKLPARREIAQVRYENKIGRVGQLLLHQFF